MIVRPIRSDPVYGQDGWVANPGKTMKEEDPGPIRNGKKAAIHGVGVAK